MRLVNSLPCLFPVNKKNEKNWVENFLCHIFYTSWKHQKTIRFLMFSGGGDKKVPVKPDIFRILKAQSAFTCSKLIIEILEQGVRYVQS